ncbi:MAG: dephospho-CoA kinase, partial [Tenericutes bacterium HGW-Tenericutes-7]
MSVQTVKTNQTIIGLTGGIGSGKTTAANHFKSLDIPVIDSDEIVKNLWAFDDDMKHEIEETFGVVISSKDDKKSFAKKIFEDEDKREKLNQIIHPRVFNQIDVLKKTLRQDKIIVIDMPLLIEVGYQNKVDKVMLIYVDLHTQLKRIMARDHLSKKDALLRIQAQMPLEEKKAYADYIVD